jgi:predicted metal-dependent HD superfamily phosphohydrolase
MFIYPKLKNLWIKLVKNYTDNESLIMRGLYILKSKYQSSGRFYHNLEHVEDMLNAVETNNIEFKDPDSTLFAIWFHDIIYNPKRSDNEVKSAEFAENFLNIIMYDPQKISLIRNMIIKTKNHRIDENDDSDTKLFLDLDLLILGANPYYYWNYVYNIRKEYSFIPDKIFYLERSKILKSFLSRKRIYKTKIFNEGFEKFAKKNIQSELRLIKMQNTYLKWLRNENNNNYDLITNKLFKITSDNGYEYVLKLDDLGPKNTFIIFRNTRNQRFISAWTNKKGFNIDELDHID